MLGAIHEVIAIEFFSELRYVFDLLPGHTRNSVIIAVGATRYSVPGVRAKEGDMGFKPDTRDGKDDWPSLLVIGILSLCRTFQFNRYDAGRLCRKPTRVAMRCDARWWFINSDGETRLVIIIPVTYQPNQKVVLIETWGMVGNPHRVTRRNPPQIPQAISSLGINDQGAIIPNNGELRIPYRSVFDVAPPAGVGDIVVTTAQLQSLVRRIFAHLR